MNFDRLVGLAGFISGVIGVLLAFYYGRRSEKRRRPTFSTLDEEFVVVDHSLHKFAFGLTYDGRSITSQHVLAIWVRFWNSGTLPISKAEVLAPYVVKLPVECSILHAKMRAISRDEIHAELVVTNNAVQIDFSILEPEDGVTVQIIFNGPRQSQVSFGGSCVGVSTPLSLPAAYVNTGSLWSELADMVVALNIPFVVLSSIFLLARLPFLERLLHPATSWIFDHMTATFLLVVLWAVAFAAYRHLRRKRLPPRLKFS